MKAPTKDVKAGTPKTPSKAGDQGQQPPGEFAPRTLTPEERKSLDDLEQAVRSGLSSFLDVGKALKAIDDKGYYKAQYPTFEDYCEKQWNMSVSYAYRQINAWECVEKLKEGLAPEGVTNFPTNEAQVRALTENLKPKQWSKKWKQVIKATGGKAITAEKVLDIVRKKAPGKPDPSTTNPGPAEEPPGKCLETLAKLVEKARSESKTLTIDDYKQLLDEIWVELKKHV